MAILKFNERPASGSASKDFARQVLWPECDMTPEPKHVGGESWLHSVSVWLPHRIRIKAHLIAEDLVSQKSWLFNNPPGFFLVPQCQFLEVWTCPAPTIYSGNNGQHRNTPIHPVELYITIKGCAGTPPSYGLTSSVTDLCNRCSCYG